MAIRYKKYFTCGSLDIAKIIYDYPTVEALKEQEEGKIKLGGCMISEMKLMRWYKNICNLINPDL